MTDWSAVFVGRFSGFGVIRGSSGCGTVEVCVVFLDTLTPEFELYVRLRERRQWGSDFPEFVLLSLVARS
ncbi:hypothetical protein Taro_021323 [Colocasia esculenta]|uniref:Uncharacterized protein n=1 Tax=Colocasia esculenta TaxID=4460 RepID=A0A843V102_COLES|nr:hypothetical protein [Colocasia esculenta]